MCDMGIRRQLWEIENLAVIEGTLSPRVRGLVIEWAALHQQELADDWDRARRMEELKKIAPLAQRSMVRC